MFCAHLVREVDKWDISQLFTQVKNFLHTENYREFGKKLEKFFSFKPEGKEDIFSFISRLDKYKEEIERMEHLAQEAGETVILPKFYMVHKILTGVEQFPQYKIFTDKIQQQQPTEWIKLTPEGIRAELHLRHANNVSLGTQNTQHTQHENRNNNNTQNNNNNNVVGLHTQRGPPPPLPGGLLPPLPPSPNQHRE